MIYNIVQFFYKDSKQLLFFPTAYLITFYFLITCFFYFQAVDLSVGELQMYGTVEWCNATECHVKTKKGTELENTVFVFKTGVVFLCREKLKKRKSKVVSVFLL